MVNYLFASEWVDLGTPEPSEPSWEVNAISSSNLEISFELKGFLEDHLKNNGSAIIATHQDIDLPLTKAKRVNLDTFVVSAKNRLSFAELENIS